MPLLEKYWQEGGLNCQLKQLEKQERKKFEINRGQISEINPGVHSGVSFIIGSNELTVSLTVSCSSELSYLSTMNLEELGK